MVNGDCTKMVVDGDLGLAGLCALMAECSYRAMVVDCHRLRHFAPRYPNFHLGEQKVLIHLKNCDSEKPNNCMQDNMNRAYGKEKYMLREIKQFLIKPLLQSHSLAYYISSLVKLYLANKSSFAVIRYSLMSQAFKPRGL